MTPNTPVGKMIGALAEYVMIIALSRVFWWMHIPNRYSLSNCDICLCPRLTVLLPCDDCRWCIVCINEQFDTVNYERALWLARCCSNTPIPLDPVGDVHTTVTFDLAPKRGRSYVSNVYLNYSRTITLDANTGWNINCFACLT
jgi:hypothetical protein